MKIQHQRNDGFTLVELLVVVAIIAILAVIATPNFLEAQVRSKISRAQADLRTIHTSVESYRVDYGSYPLDGNDAASFVSAAEYDSRLRLRVLTTPVAYTTTLPVDPFNLERAPNAGPLDLLFFQGEPPYTFMYTTYGSFETRPPHNLPAHRGNPDEYTLGCVGPNRIFDSGLEEAIDYDPTNGTVSVGDLLVYGGRRTELRKRGSDFAGPR